MSRGLQRLGFIGALTLFVGLAMPASARADIIGSFSWDDCGLFGPCFSVGNTSDLSAFPMDFTSALVTLSTDQGSIPESLTALMPISIEASAQTVGDYSALDISLVTLSLAFSQPGTISLFDATSGLLIAGLTTAGETASIDFEPSSQPVPEPSTLVLLAAGIGILGLASTARHRLIRAAPAQALSHRHVTRI